MGLLSLGYNRKLLQVAQEVFDEEMEMCKKLNIELEETQKETIFERTIHHIISLRVAVSMDEDNIYQFYVDWVYTLFHHHVQGLSLETKRMYLLGHYTLMLEKISLLLNEEDIPKGRELLQLAIEKMQTSETLPAKTDYINNSEYSKIRKDLLDNLLNKDLTAANILINNINNAVGLVELYTEIIQPVLKEVGELWHQNEITVAQEHYCSSFIQSAMLQFYEVLFEQPRNQNKVVVACPEGELHQIGARMISDLFEFNGWTSIFLGAAVPSRDLIRTLQDEQPQVCALAVCMPEGLPTCCAVVKEIKEKFPQIIVAVGGRAFEQVKNPLAKTGADIFSSNFEELLIQVQNRG